MHTVLPLTNLNKSKQGIGTRIVTIQVISIPSVKSFHVHGFVLTVMCMQTHAWLCVLSGQLHGTGFLHPPFVGSRAHTEPPGLRSSSSAHWMSCWPQLHSSPCLLSWIFSQETRKSQGKAPSLKDCDSCFLSPTSWQSTLLSAQWRKELSKAVFQLLQEKVHDIFLVFPGQ